MTLTTARATLLVSRFAFAAPLGQLRCGRRRRTFAIDFDHQHLAILGRRLKLLHERCRVASHAEHHLLDRLGGRRPI